MRLIRYLLVLPAAAFTGALVAYFGVRAASFAVGYATSQLCPDLSEASCNLAWRPLAIEGAMAAVAGISAVFVVLSSVVLAPANKLNAGMLTYGIGLAVATYALSTDDDFLYGWVAAVLAGAATLLIARRRLSVRPVPGYRIR